MNFGFLFKSLFLLNVATLVLMLFGIQPAMAGEPREYVKAAEKMLIAKDTQGAVSVLESGLKSDPEDSDAYFVLGQAYALQGRKDLSSKNYKLAIMYDHIASSAAARYMIKSDEVYDKSTGLVWQRCSVGQKWMAEAGCTGHPSQFTFEEAQQQATGTWRIPSKTELATLLDKKRVAADLSMKIDDVAFPGMDENQLWYWTSTADNATFAWSVGFGSDNKYNGYSYRSYKYGLRLVRKGD